MTVRPVFARSWATLGLSLCSVSILFPLEAAAQTHDDDQVRQDETRQTEAPDLSLPDPSKRPEPNRDPAFLKLPPLSQDSTAILDPEERWSSRTSNDDEVRERTVTLRKRPAYDPQGLDLGGFTLFPEASLNAGFDGNVFAQPDGVSDVYAQARASAKLQSNWSRHSISVDGFVDRFTYAEYSSENATTYRARATTRLDIRDRQSISTKVERSYTRVSRGAVGESIRTQEPARYYLTSAEASGRGEWGRYSAELTGAVSRYDYKDSTDLAGAPVNQQFRDHRRYQLRLDLAYTVGAARSIFVSLSGDRRRYRVPPPPTKDPDGNEIESPLRDSNGYEIIAGIRSEITPLIHGQIGVGYILVDFRDPGVSTRKALTVDTRLDYLFTELTTFSLSARRSLENVGNPSTPATLNTRVRLGVDHELLRNLILTAGATYEHADYVNAPNSADYKAADFGAAWLINRRLRAEASIGVRDRNGKGGSIADRDYREFVASAGLTFRL